jgi:hypothetical protein
MKWSRSRNPGFLARFFRFFLTICVVVEADRVGETKEALSSFKETILSSG